MCTHGSGGYIWYGCNINISTEPDNSTPDVCRAYQHSQVLVSRLSLGIPSATPGGHRQGSEETLLVSGGHILRIYCVSGSARNSQPLCEVDIIIFVVYMNKPGLREVVVDFLKDMSLVG